MKVGMNECFFDTYAIVELNKGNTNYSKYLDSTLVTTLLNLMEFYNTLLRENAKEIAIAKFNKYLPSCIQLNSDIIKEAVEFRLEFNKETKFKISYVDAIGYIISLKLGIEFLTGDDAFKDLKNVEFVK